MGLGQDSGNFLQIGPKLVHELKGRQLKKNAVDDVIAQNLANKVVQLQNVEIYEIPPPPVEIPDFYIPLTYPDILASIFLHDAVN